MYIKDIENVPFSNPIKESFVQRTTKKEQIIYFIFKICELQPWVTLESIRAYLKSLGVKNGRSNVQKELNAMEGELITIHKCHDCGESRCIGCPYDSYRKDKHIKDKRQLAKYVVSITNKGRKYAKSIIKDLKLSYLYLKNGLTFKSS